MTMALSHPERYPLHIEKSNSCHVIFYLVKGAVSRNSAKLGNYKMPVKLRET